MNKQEFKDLKFGQHIELADGRRFKVIDVAPDPNGATTLVLVGGYIANTVPWKKLTPKKSPWLSEAKLVLDA